MYPGQNMFTRAGMAPLEPKFKNKAQNPVRWLSALSLSTSSRTKVFQEGQYIQKAKTHTTRNAQRNRTYFSNLCISSASHS